MVMNDTLSNALSKISQYEKIGRLECVIGPSSKVIIKVLELLKKFGYIENFEKMSEGKKMHIKVKLNGKINECGVIKPRFSVKGEDFEKYEKRYLPARDIGIIIVSTVDGMMDYNKAKEKKIGGRLIAYCY